MRCAMPPVRPWSPGCFLCTTSSTLRELPVAGVNLLSAQDARIEIGGGGAQIRGSGRPGLAAQPQSRRCSECCDSIHPPAGHIYQCVPSFERAEHEIAVCWQLGEQRTGGAAIQRTGGAANRGSQHKRSNELRGVPFIFCIFTARGPAAVPIPLAHGTRGARFVWRCRRTYVATWVS